MLVWEHGAFEHDKGADATWDKLTISTMPGKYYGGHSPCAVNANYPLCGTWM